MRSSDIHKYVLFFTILFHLEKENLLCEWLYHRWPLSMNRDLSTNWSCMSLSSDTHLCSHPSPSLQPLPCFFFYLCNIITVLSIGLIYENVSNICRLLWNVQLLFTGNGSWSSLSIDSQSLEVVKWLGKVTWPVNAKLKIWNHYWNIQSSVFNEIFNQIVEKEKSS